MVAASVAPLASRRAAVITVSKRIVRLMPSTFLPLPLRVVHTGMMPPGEAPVNRLIGLCTNGVEYKFSEVRKEKSVLV